MEKCVLYCGLTYFMIINIPSFNNDYQFEHDKYKIMYKLELFDPWGHCMSHKMNLL